MYTYKINVKNKITNELISSKTISGFITFRQVLSGKVYEDQLENMKTCIFTERFDKVGDEENNLQFLYNYLWNIKQQDKNNEWSIEFYSIFTSGIEHLIKRYETMSTLDLVLTTISSSTESMLGYQLIVGE